MAIIGTSLCVLGVGLSAFCTSLITFTLCFGVLFGLGTGLAYTVPFMVSWGHYPSSRARVTGLLMAVFGYSTTIFNLVTTAIVNPNNDVATIVETEGLVVSHYFTEDIARRTPTMLLWLAGIYGLLAIIGVLLISEAPNKAQAQGPPPKVSVSVSDLTSTTFLILYFASFLSIALSMYISSAYKIYGGELFKDDKYLAVVGSVSALVNGTSRFLWAEALEWWGFKKVYIGLLAVQILTSATLYPVARTEFMYMLYMILIFINQGCHFVIFPALMVKMYGRMKGALLYSILYSEFGFSALATFLIQKYAIRDIGYESMYHILTAGAILSLILVLPFQEIKEEQGPLAQPLLQSSSEGGKQTT